MSNSRLTLLVETAIMAALAYVLSFVAINGLWGQGGSVSLVMIPIMVLAIRRGLAVGLLAGLVVGLLKLIGGYIVHPVQAILDYPLAFAVLGFAGIVKLTPQMSRGHKIVLTTAGAFVGVLLRFVCHFLSGVIWFGSYAPEGTPVSVYSAVYNVSYLLPEFIITAVIVSLIAVGAPQLFKPRGKDLSVGQPS